ncbi:MAG TPA: NAD(P)-dependent oxidoreductase [Spongiibacteraceae bacterium]|jgi:3-hydroxyisobutyrate dehydrogenase-like beta-hydroxyacid dehydrogenase|nr:NAD(P)-dependent oxidoreductase [Spongiibacteraceae bacterium]
MNIGFIGLGNIGAPMAAHLFKQGEPVWVYDVFPEAMQPMVARGATAAESPAALAAACGYIGICVRDDRDVDALFYEAGLLNNAAAGTVLAIHSTVTQASILRWAKDANARGLTLVDAPITGGASGAEQGKLCYMVGGDAKTIAVIRPIISTSAAKIVEAGPLGSGIALKLCNNLMSYLSFIAMREAANLAKASGLALEKLNEVGAANGVVTPMMAAFLSGQEAVAPQGEAAMQKAYGAFAALGKKDLAAALESADALGVRMPGTRCAHELITAAFLNQYS